MAERFRQIVDRIVEKWKSWSAKQKYRFELQDIKSVAKK